MTEHRDPGMIEHAPSCHLQHGLGGRCTCGASADPMPPDLPDRMSAAVAEELRRIPSAFPHPRADGRLGRGLSALIPDGTPLRPFGKGVTVRQGDEVPSKLDGFRRSMFEWNDFGQHDDAAREAIDRVLQTLIAEDGRARSTLPDPPPGWEWHADVRSDATGEAVLGEVTIRLVYRLREVPL